MQFNIVNRFTGAVKFEADIDCAEDAPYSVKITLAARAALMSRADLSKANLSWADLSKADLSKANLSWADLSKANLSEANLSWADLSKAGKGIPVIENIHQTVYQAASTPPEALNMETWHTCETTHCRAGWVVTLAGPAGAALEWAIGTNAAASLIYKMSDPHLERVPDFYCDNATALADMKRLAEEEAARHKEKKNE